MLGGGRLGTLCALGALGALGTLDTLVALGTLGTAAPSVSSAPCVLPLHHAPCAMHSSTPTHTHTCTHTRARAHAHTYTIPTERHPSLEQTWRDSAWSGSTSYTRREEWDW